MNFVLARNKIASRLEEHIGCPVVLSEQIAEMPEFPYCYYSVLSPRISDHSFGLQNTRKSGDGYLKSREEMVDATMSFTFCSMNREADGAYIFGEDEALMLSEKAHGFFLLNAHNIGSSADGDIVIKNIGSVANRSGFLVEDTIRRYGFDIRFSYVRTDEQYITTIKSTGDPKGDLHV